MLLEVNHTEMYAKADTLQGLKKVLCTDHTQAVFSSYSVLGLTGQGSMQVVSRLSQNKSILH